MYKSNKQLNCTTCGKKLFGRKDKRYCSDKCKNKYHREAKKLLRNKKIENKTKARNYIVLLGIFRSKTKRIRVHQDLLFYYGFDISKFDRIIHIKNERILYFQSFRLKLFSNGIIEITNLDNRELLTDIFTNRWKADFPDEFEEDTIYTWKRNFSFKRLEFFSI